MPVKTPERGATDRHGPILFGLMAVGLLLPHLYAFLVSFLTSPLTPPILYGRPILWGAIVYFLYLGYPGVRWLVLAGVVLGASTLGWQAMTVMQAGYPLPAAGFAALALAQVAGAALLFGSRTLREWLLARRSKRLRMRGG
jgi:hypothetical protein